MKYIHTQGRNGCNYGILGEYEMGDFPKHLSAQEELLARPQMLSVSWTTADGKSVFTDEIKRANVIVYVEENTECIPEMMEKLTARPRRSRKKPTTDVLRTPAC